MDSAYLRGWRWLVSPRYRDEIRVRYTDNPALVVAGALLTIALMFAEVVAVVLILRELVRP